MCHRIRIWQWHAQGKARGPSKLRHGHVNPGPKQQYRQAMGKAGTRPKVGRQAGQEPQSKGTRSNVGIQLRDVR